MDQNRPPPALQKLIEESSEAHPVEEPVKVETHPFGKEYCRKSMKKTNMEGYKGEFDRNGWNFHKMECDGCGEFFANIIKQKLEWKDLPLWSCFDCNVELCHDCGAEAFPKLIAEHKSEEQLHTTTTGLDCEEKSDIQSHELNCPWKHGLKQFTTTKRKFCNVCDVSLRIGSTTYGCRKCNWDVCSDCWHSPPVKIQTHPGSRNNCNKAMEKMGMKDFKEKYESILTPEGKQLWGFMSCDGCKKNFTNVVKVARDGLESLSVWSCFDCNQDLCHNCWGLSQ